MSYAVQEIANAVEGELNFGFFQQEKIENILIDSRQINAPHKSIFVALISNKNDGHQYIQNAYEKGVRNFLVSNKKAINSLPKANFILVDNTLLALQKLTSFHRNQFNLKTIGITGSNGKTIIKEWLFELLNDSFFTVKSPKSYNSQIGVPLSVWQIQEAHQLGIFEAGISTINEMDKIAPIIQCDIGIFTNIGTAHNEGFDSIEQKVAEKLKLFQFAKTIIYCKDQLEIHDAIKHYDSNRLFSWSFEKDADLQITKTTKTEYNSTSLTANYRGQSIQINIPYTDEAYVENAIHCWACCLHLGIEHEVIQERIRQLQPLAMRLEMKNGINNSYLINDSYNSDLDSLKIALDFLSQQAGNNNKTLILSDIPQSGISSSQLYQKIATLIVGKNISNIVGIGKEVANLVDHLPAEMELQFFFSTDQFIQKIPDLTFANQYILIKGARSFQFEKVSAFLSNQIHETSFEINLNALTHNYNFFKSRLNKDTKMMVMIKASAYGSGSTEVARLLDYNGVDYFATAYPDEGIQLRNEGIKTPIMVLNAAAHTFDAMIRYQLEPEIYSHRQLNQLIEFLKVKNNLSARQSGNTIGIHLKIDTGMHRLGFEDKDITSLIQKLKDHSNIKVNSIFSHLAASEDPNDDNFTLQQIQIFEKIYTQITTKIGYKPMRHLLNSPGIIRFPQYQMDLVRLGIGLYGLDMSQTIENQLKIVHTLKATISQIREVNKGETIGYNRTELATSKLKIATISIGYADGLPRLAGHRKYFVSIHDKLKPIVGSVCMDMCMVDITDDHQIKEGDEVIVFGNNPSIKDLAAIAQTIPYEIFTNISERVKRVYFQD